MCINEVTKNSNGTCDIYKRTQHSFIVGDSAPENGQYSEFGCSWRGQNGDR